MVDEVDMDKVKTIRIEYLPTNRKFDVTIKNNNKISELITKIQDKIGGGITLVNLMIKPPIGRNSRPLPTDGELTIYDAKIRDLSTITIGKDNVIGG